MKKALLIISLVAVALAACATTDNTTYVLTDNGNPAQYARDLDQCKFETTQQHRAKDPRANVLVVDCMVSEKGYSLVKK